MPPLQYYVLRAGLLCVLCTMHRRLRYSCAVRLASPQSLFHFSVNGAQMYALRYFLRDFCIFLLLSLFSVLRDRGYSCPPARPPALGLGRQNHGVLFSLFLRHEISASPLHVHQGAHASSLSVLLPLRLKLVLLCMSVFVRRDASERLVADEVFKTFFKRRRGIMYIRQLLPL